MRRHGGVLYPSNEWTALGVTFWIVSTVPADPCPWQRGGPPVGPTVNDLASALVNQSRMRASTPTPVTLAGYAGKHLTLRTPGGVDFGGHDRNGRCDRWFFINWGSPSGELALPTTLLSVAKNQLSSGHFDELWILDVHGIRLVVDAAYWLNTPARDRADVHRIVESVRIERDS